MNVVALTSSHAGCNMAPSLNNNPSCPAEPVQRTAQRTQYAWGQIHYPWIIISLVIWIKFYYRYDKSQFTWNLKVLRCDEILFIGEILALINLVVPESYAWDNPVTTTCSIIKRVVIICARIHPLSEYGRCEIGCILNERARFLALHRLDYVSLFLFYTPLRRKNIKK